MDCPIPISTYPAVTMAHGGGGRLMQQLIGDMFATAFAEIGLQSKDDAACLDLASTSIAYTTDSFVVSPIEFPGGDIGKLAVYGTVNDLATAGAIARHLSLGFILEEGLEMDVLWRIVVSIADACKATGVQLVTGDTKVVDRGKGDKLFINTSGIGIRPAGIHWSAEAVREGDVVLISGDVGRHGMAIMAARESLAFDTDIVSDCAPLNDFTAALRAASVMVRCARDLTRGGLASATNEIAAAAGVQFRLDERRISVQPQVKAACEVLGLDPLYVANEGRMMIVVHPESADAAEAVINDLYPEFGGGTIGVVEAGPGRVVIRTVIGADRVLSLLSGEQLPRIC